MKSIMQEASTISKAIDQAWNRADKPAEFSVKILEEPEHNLFGLTVKSAKIAIYFEERRKQEVYTRQLNRQRPIRQEQQRHPQESAPKPAQEKRKPSSDAQPQRRPRPEWTDQMAREAQEWLNRVLELMNASDKKYSASHSKSALKIVFKESVTGSEGKDRVLFSSFAGLILATLRYRYKRQLRNLKVILTIE